MPTPSPIKQRIQELVPDIMELKFGCKVYDRTGEWDFIEKKGDLFICWNGTSVCEVEALGCSILGRPITLPDVMRAIQVCDENRILVVTDQGDMHFEGERVIKCTWNLAIPDLDGQSDECKRFIGELLGVKSQS